MWESSLQWREFSAEGWPSSNTHNPPLCSCFSLTVLTPRLMNRGLPLARLWYFITALSVFITLLSLSLWPEQLHSNPKLIQFNAAVILSMCLCFSSFPAAERFIFFISQQNVSLRSSDLTAALPCDVIHEKSPCCSTVVTAGHRPVRHKRRMTSTNQSQHRAGEDVLTS